MALVASKTTWFPKAAALMAVLFLMLVPSAQLKERTSGQERYVREALSRMDGGIHADSSAWRQARSDAIREAGSLQSMDAAYALLDRVARIAGGGHSSFSPPDQTLAYRSATGDHALPVVEVNDRIGTIKLPGFASDNLEALQRYSDAGIRQIAETAPTARCGWILDLRNHSGGSVYSILGAVTPLIDDGKVLSYAYPDGRTLGLRFEGPRILAPDGSVWSDSAVPFPLLDSPPIAILQDKGTVSAGEAIIVALTGQDGVRSFGRETRGYTALNDLIPMDDGAILAITVAHNVDRFGKVYGGPIPPDERIQSYNDDFASAKAWLLAQC